MMLFLLWSLLASRASSRVMDANIEWCSPSLSGQRTVWVSPTDDVSLDHRKARRTVAAAALPTGCRLPEPNSKPPEVGADCDAACMEAILFPWALTGAEEGFRHAMAAYNTTDICLDLAHCRASASFYIDEIAHLATKEGVRDSETYRNRTRMPCDSKCMLNTMDSVVNHAGATAMAIGQKNYHGADAVVLRWFPQPAMILDSMIADLSENDVFVNATSLRQHEHQCEFDCYNFIDHPVKDQGPWNFKTPDYRRDVHPDFVADLRKLVLEQVSLASRYGDADAASLYGRAFATFSTKVDLDDDDSSELDGDSEGSQLRRRAAQKGFWGRAQRLWRKLLGKGPVPPDPDPIRPLTAMNLEAYQQALGQVKEMRAVKPKGFLNFLKETKYEEVPENHDTVRSPNMHLFWRKAY